MTSFLFNKRVFIHVLFPFIVGPETIIVKGCFRFVAHPHCQQLLTSIWYEGLPGWRKRNGPTKFLLCMGLILIVPFMAVYYLIFPRSKIGQLLRSPFMKFLYHSASFGVFLILLVCLSTEFGTDDDREQQRGPPPSQLEWFICFWVMGFVWAECKQLWEEGLKAYIRQWWNWLDFIMLSLYLATFSLRFVAYLQVESGRYGPRVLHRQYWPMLDPTLLSEGLFAVANVFSFSRIIYLAQANQHLGPLQISLGCMLIDIAKFLIIFFLVLTSFACGLNRLYWYYNKSRADDDPEAFFSLGESYVTLYWSLFGITRKNDITIRHGQYFTELMGMLMFMAYHGMAIIVLINMLIAMMSSSFQNIEVRFLEKNHADMEWKFARSKLWMSYFDEGSTLPSPFNLIISPKSIWYIIRHVKSLVTRCTRERKQIHANRRKRSSAGTIKRPHFHGDPFKVPPSYDHIHYQDVMRRLVSRYIHQSKKKKQQDGVNEDDLLEIKQDISSLRYELRDDRKLESERANTLIQDLKHELICILHGILPEKGPGSTSSRGGNPVNGTTYCTLSKKDLQDIKRDIVDSICTEVKGNLRESVIGFDSSGPPSSNMPSLDSELYQTHLYTQL
ncbi:hypothetical protein FSP39_007126 [Pinctada imbricata]|uniref:Ion transport domain-containing protein n=1 Tax=Pinctada imbricata TaxID=66713 RepID=A0AA89C505_PINIB|nr:hypothetical protein FSP39_007126 [Pinctada imbricata]